MTLVKSISGMRGTIGGEPGEGLTPVDLLKFLSGFAGMLRATKNNPTVVIGRDGRSSGEAILAYSIGILRLCGCHVINLDLSTTPTVEMAVPFHEADGGIILTASHNPREWNALKFLNERGEFISADYGEKLLGLSQIGPVSYPSNEHIGSLRNDDESLNRHIEAILTLPYIPVQKIRERRFKVVVDAINSTGSLAIPPLLNELGVEYDILNDTIDGNFAHNPEPLPLHLEDLKHAVRSTNADLGIAVDPDVDRLALFGPRGKYFGEEYTLVAVADHVLERTPGPTVSNLSSTKALGDLSKKYAVPHHQSAVGEVNVVQLMKETQAVIGGEGNGGVILPELHYGRDALAGIGLILGLLAERNTDLNTLKESYTTYHMVKDKMPLEANLHADDIIVLITDAYKNSHEVSTIDGVKINFEEGWVHLRKSNTEPIIRLYAEGKTKVSARSYIKEIKNMIFNI
ncbi:MAG: phosphoglucosamine mutase [Saprospiraceae bacterium]|nr:phosphoglucosamine mutase [Saprospiraceae bacterium]